MSSFRNLSLKPVVLLIIITFFITAILPARGFAAETYPGDVASEVKTASAQSFKSSRTDDTIIVSEGLKRLGLGEMEISERIGKLSDSELHYFASNNSDIYPGGSITGAIILTAVILAAAYAYIKYTGKRVVIE